MKKENNKEQKTLEGNGISLGQAMGRAFVYKDMLSRDLRDYRIREEDVERELERLKQAFSLVLKDIKILEKNVKKELGKEQSDIFKVHADILRDKTLLNDIKNVLEKELVTADRAVKKVFKKWADKFKVSQNEVLKSKAEDLEDLSRRVLCSFMGCDINILENVPPGSIVVSKRLLPSDTVRLKRKDVKGIVVEQGSNVSHSAIIARSLGIPAVAGIKNAPDLIKPGQKIIVNGYKGIVTLDPEPRQIKTYRKIVRSEKKMETELIGKAKRVSRTKDGKIVKVYANIASKDDAKAAVDRGCDGVGLLRIEQLYMSSKTLPDEKYLLKRLKDILNPVKDKLVTLRLLDLGADKTLPYLEIEDEPSPVLGLRGVRLLLRYRNLLKTQLKTAIILSRDHNIRLLVPVVTFYQEMEEIKEVMESCASELERELGKKIRQVKIGAMIETPAAVENIEKISKVSDFLSIGTNDLIQYSVAAGRDNPSVSEYYEQGAKVAIKYIRRIVKHADKHGLECSICGEMAGELKWLKSLVKTNIKVLSLSPYLIPLIKEEIRKIRIGPRKKAS